MIVPNPNNGFVPMIGDVVRFIGACRPKLLNKLGLVVLPLVHKNSCETLFYDEELKEWFYTSGEFGGFAKVSQHESNEFFKKLLNEKKEDWIIFPIPKRPINLNSSVSGFVGTGTFVKSEIEKYDDTYLVSFQFDILTIAAGNKDDHGDDQRGYWFLPSEIKFDNI